MKKQIQSKFTLTAMIFASFISQKGLGREFESASQAAGFVYSQKLWNMVYVDRCSAQLPYEKEALANSLSYWLSRNKRELIAAEKLTIAHTYNNAALIEAVESAAMIKAYTAFSSIPPEERKKTCGVYLKQTANGELDIKSIEPKASKLLIAYIESNPR